MNNVIIIGGGVAGLMAALHLAERGVRPLLLEAHPTHIGGRLRDEPVVEIDHNGHHWRFTAEHGVHGIWSPYRNFTATLARHGILPALIPSREEGWLLGEGGRVRRASLGNAIRSSPFPAPFHYLHLFLRPRFLNILTPRDLLALPRVFGGLLVALAFDPLAEQTSLRRMSLAQLTAGWSPRISSFFAGLARNGLAAHPEDVPAAGFIAFLRFYTLLRRDAWGFSYLPGTGGALVAEPLANMACSRGAVIRLGARALRLARVEAGWRVSFEVSGTTEAAEAQQLVMALDAPAAQRLLAASPATAEGARALHFPIGVLTAIVRVWFAATPRPGPVSGICSGDFIVDNFFWLHQLQKEYRAWSEATGGSALEMHIYGPPELLAQPDAVLLARAVNDAGRAFPELRGHVIHSTLQRNPIPHTLFGVGEAGEHLGVETPWEALFACGDWVAHPTPALYLERATTTGIAAANAVLEQRGLHPWPLEPFPEPEWLVGKMQAGMRSLRRAVVSRSQKG
jgi:isorenieratene synthase